MEPNFGFFILSTVVFSIKLVNCDPVSDLMTDLSVARQFLTDFDARAETLDYAYAVANWNYTTNLTSFNNQQLLKASLRRSVFLREAALNTTKFGWKSFDDDFLKRQFQEISDAGISVLPQEDVMKFNLALGDLEAIYSKARVCGNPTESSHSCYLLDPGLTHIMSSSRDWEELTWAWKGWRDVTGRKMKTQYSQAVELMNKAARIQGYHDTGEWWRSDYGDSVKFEKRIAEIWEQIKPLYQHLHAYIRRKLRHIYKDRSFPASGHIPAHLLGNMWAQQWSAITNDVLPFPDHQSLDFTEAMHRQNYTSHKMFKMAEEFFTSLGLDPMPASFWENSMLEKPKDGRDVVCHASAWDFGDQKDFRIKMCTVVNIDDFTTIHHEMGHVQYYIQYKHLPGTLRGGANPGFHEALGDVMALSVSTPEHMQKIGLLHEIVNDTAFDLNYLMLIALDKLAFPPFGYLVDQWRWSVFRGDTPIQDYNKKWWELRCRIQGISPPVSRSEEDFDAGAKYHVPGNTPYIRYFVSFIIQFQFHKALCESAGHSGPLHRCDIYNSTLAGDKLREMLSLGASKPWEDAMEVLTGQREIDAGPLVEFFQPILDWLIETNEGHEVGWDESRCPEGSFVVGTGSSSYGTSCWIVLAALVLICLVTVE